MNGPRRRVCSDVQFTDTWSEGIYSESEVAEFIARNPIAAREYHVVNTNMTYEQFVRELKAQSQQSLVRRVISDVEEAADSVELFQRIVSRCRQEFGADAAALFLEVPGDSARLQLVSAAGYAKSLPAGTVVYEWGVGLTGRVWSTGQSLKIDSRDELVRHPSRTGKHDGLQWGDACLCENLAIVAVRDAIRPFGVLKVENKRGEGGHVPFTDADLGRLEVIAALISLAVREAGASVTD